ncbi:MAG: S1 RNA-binding domain-containing protein [Chloroflexota bacterium]
MSTQTTLDTAIEEMDFAAMLEESLADSYIERGDMITGTILHVDQYGLIVDVGWKHDGIVSRTDIDRMGMTTDDFEVGSELDVTVVRLVDGDGNLVLSAAQAKQNEDWKRAEAIKEEDDVYTGVISAANKGGLIMPYGNLRGFIPASHVVDMPRGLNDEDRIKHLTDLVDTEISVKVIEVNRKRRRLVFSQRLAERENRQARKEELLDKLEEGNVRKGVVSGLCDFGAFVDLGGADGLVHISELAWHRVSHPEEVVTVGQKVEVYILNLDESGKRIGLSLKRLQKNPWDTVEEVYHIGQLVEGTVSRIEPFGAFISMEPGIEALLHISQMSDDEVHDPRNICYEGERILTRIISIEANKQRLGLSLKEVTKAEHAQWEEDRSANLMESAAEEADEEAVDAEAEIVAEAGD